MTLIPAGIYMRKGTTQPGMVDNTTITNPKVVHSPVTSDQTRAPGMQLTYNDDPAEGTLFVSVSPVETTDGYGNDVPEGVSVQGSSGQQITMQVVDGTPQALFSTGSDDEESAGFLSMGINTVDSATYLYTVLQSPTATSQGDYVLIFLNSPGVPADFNAGGNLVYVSTSDVFTDVLTWGSSGVQVIAIDHAGDTNTYRTERLTSPCNTTDVTSTGLTDVSDTLSLGTGTYRISGQVVLQADQSAGFAFFELSGGPAVLSDCRITWMEFVTPGDDDFGVSLTLGNAGTMTNLGQAFSTATFTTGQRCIRFDGTITVSTAGELAIQAACGTSGDTFTVYGYGSYLQIDPI